MIPAYLLGVSFTGILLLHCAIRPSWQMVVAALLWPLLLVVAIGFVIGGAMIVDEVEREK